MCQLLVGQIETLGIICANLIFYINFDIFPKMSLKGIQLLLTCKQYNSIAMLSIRVREGNVSMVF